MSAFDEIAAALSEAGPSAAFDALERTLRANKDYAGLFEALLMRKRHELGMPLIQGIDPYEVSAEKRPAYEEAFLAAAREAGGLYLADGDIPRAWRYYRAIGESGPIARAIENLKQHDAMEDVVAIALHEGVNPRKGFELVLNTYGICRAITLFEQYPDRDTREHCLNLLVRTLHRELLENLGRAIERREGAAPAAATARELIEGRDWLFGAIDYYVDTSHLVSVLRFSLEARHREVLAMAVDMTYYGERLSSNFQFRTEPPFDDIYADHRIYLQALLGENVEPALEHFRAKLAGHPPETSGYGPLQALTRLLLRLERFDEAISLAREYFRDSDPRQYGLPSIVQMYGMAGDYEGLEAHARGNDDLLNFTAAAAEARR